MDNLHKTLSDPGVLFSLANIFAFAQSDNNTAFFIAFITALIAISLSYYKFNPNTPPESLKLLSAKIVEKLPDFLVGNPDNIPLRINAYGVLAASFSSFASFSVLPGIAGIAFASGNFLASSTHAQNIQKDHSIKGFQKAAGNPVVYYGVGYAMIGLMAGGGYELLTNPFHHLGAFVTTCIGIGVTTLSSVGLVKGKFPNPAVPFLAVAVGTTINTISGFLSGNIYGIMNNLLATSGQIRLAQLNFHEINKKEKTTDSLSDKFFGCISAYLLNLLKYCSLPH